MIVSKPRYSLKNYVPFIKDYHEDIAPYLGGDFSHFTNPQLRSHLHWLVRIRADIEEFKEPLLEFRHRMRHRQVSHKGVFYKVRRHIKNQLIYRI